MRAFGAMRRNTAKIHPVWLFALAALGVCGIAWAVVKVMLAAGGGTILALIRDAGQQVGGRGFWGAFGAAFGGAWNSVFGSGPGAGASGRNPTVNASGPGVKVGRDGSWRDAIPGMGIGGDEFVKIPPGSTVSVTLPDGSTKNFPGSTAGQGGAIIPGKWLTGDDPGSIWVSTTAQNAATWITGDTTKTKGNGGGKA